MFFIDVTTTPEDKDKALEELDKLTKQVDEAIPISIGLTKVDEMETITWTSYKTTLNKSLQNKYPTRK